MRLGRFAVRLTIGINECKKVVHNARFGRVRDSTSITVVLVWVAHHYRFRTLQ